jgi:hypothetical protein
MPRKFILNKGRLTMKPGARGRTVLGLQVRGKVVLPSRVKTPTSPAEDWILATGQWNDGAPWNDTAVWID